MRTRLAAADSGSKRRGVPVLAKSVGLAGGALLALILLVASAAAGDLQLKIPRRTKPTPVQQLNQQGVKYLVKNDITGAKRVFYKAYLLDPDDPFTLNNLGYVAELDGEIERAQKFYELAAANSSDATVALSSNPELEGRHVSQVAGNAVSAPMQVNRLNVAAMGLMMKDRASEAEVTLRRALALDPQNPFTLNNLGYALEKEGELEQAVRFYTQAAAGGSNEKVVVALNRSWRGRPITEIASRNATAARRELSAEGSSEAKVARLNLRGVSALNSNQKGQALRFFQEAYRLDPGNAFCLNNMGYIAELQGDRESADFYYEKARAANHNDVRVTLATRKQFEGQKLGAVADQNGEAVQAALDRQLAAIRASGVPPLPLRTRNNAFVREPATPPVPEPEIPVRVVAEDNPPPERPKAVAAQQPAKRANQAPGNTQTAPAQQRTLSQQTQVQPQVQAPVQQPVQPQYQPVPTTTPRPEDDTPLLPVIPD